MERERITLIATSNINYDQRLQKIASSLAKRGAEVLLLGRAKGAAEVESPKNYRAKNLTCFFEKGVFFYMEINLRFFFFLLANKTDKLCANDTDTLLAAYLASFFRNFTFYFDAHEYFSEVPELEGKKLKKRMWNFIERLAMKRVDQAYTVNQSLAEIFIAKYHKDFQVLRNTPVLEELHLEAHREAYILYQGALNKGRGLEVLIETMQQIDRPLYLAGKGDLEQELKFLVKKLNLEHKVKFLGNLHPEELKEVSKKAYLGINILEASSLNYYYSLANKFFDYMHAGVPQISMAFPEYQRIVSQFKVALLIDSLDVESLYNAIQEVEKDKSLYQEIQAQCREAAQVYNWTKEEEVLYSIYFN
ncbi:MAG: glycosyltransferase [Chitinophagales bacterium]